MKTNTNKTETSYLIKKGDYVKPRHEKYSTPITFVSKEFICYRNSYGVEKNIKVNNIKLIGSFIVEDWNSEFNHNSFQELS